MRAVWKHAVGCGIAIAAFLQCACNDGRREGNVDTLIPPLAIEMEALRKAYAAFNRNDIAATVEALHPQVEWTEPPEFPGGGTYHGHEGVKTYLSQSRARWAEGRSEPERFIVAGDRIIVFVHVRARLKDSRQWHEARLIPVVVMTSSNEEQDIVESYRLGVNSYIVKPVAFEAFLETVTKIGLYWVLTNRIPQ